MAGTAAARTNGHDNALGFIRLALASLVIVAHTPEMVDGDRHREPLTRIFHTISFGEFAVDGFFVISGFLITASFFKLSDWRLYLRHRVARIYPAFVVSSLMCVLLVAPAVEGRFQRGLASSVARVAGRIAILCPPYVSGTFPGTHYPLLNGSAWTIQYEFAMYLAVLLLGAAGLLRLFRFVTVMATACLLLAAVAPARSGSYLDQLALHQYVFQGPLRDAFRFAGIFLTGAALYLKRDRLRPNRRNLAVAIALLVASLCFLPLAHAGTALFGGYALLLLSTMGRDTVFARINGRDDVSYGLYLYAWPIGKLLLWCQPTIDLLLAGIETWVLATAAGYASWMLVERGPMNWSRHWRSRGGVTAMAKDHGHP